MSNKTTMRQRRERQAKEAAMREVMAMNLSADARQKLLGMIDSAFWTVKHGRAPGIDEWSTLASMVNTVDAFVKNGCVSREDAAMPLSGAHRALVDAQRRFTRGQGMRFDGVGMLAMEQAYAIYTQCLEELTAGDVTAAIKAAFDLQIAADVREAECI